MTTLNGLPVFKMKPGKGIDFTSLVKDPAIEVLYKTFANKEIYKFNKEKQIVTGPVMIPDLPIYRFDKTHGEYYVIFDKETISELHEIAMNEKKTLSFNYQHQNNSQIIGAVLIESWFIAENDNKAKELGFDLPVGTLMYSVKINNKDFWEKEIKSGNVKGFSIEGYLDMVALSKNNFDSKNKKTLGKIQKYDIVKRAQNNDLYISGSIAVGNYVYYSNPQIVLIGTEQQELRSPIWENNVMLADGRVLELSDGKIVQIIEASKASEHLKKYNKNKFMEAKTDKGTLKTADENFQVGSMVTLINAEGKEAPATEGEYKLENGTVISCDATGKILTIVEATEQEDSTPEEQAALKKVFDKIFGAEITALKTKIAELETKLSQIPSAGSATGKTDTDDQPKQTAGQIAMEKIARIKEATKKK